VTTEARHIHHHSPEDRPQRSPGRCAELAPEPPAPAPAPAPAPGEIRTAIFVYDRITLTLTCARPVRVSAFRGAGPDVYLDAGSHELAVEAGVYLVRASERERERAGADADADPGASADADAPVRVRGFHAGTDADVATIAGGKLSRRTPRRLFQVLPSIKRRELAQFLRSAPPPEERPLREIRRVLVIDEDEAATSRYARGFGPERTVVAVRDPAQARELVASAPWDLAIVELRVGGASGIQLALELKRAQPALVIALCSGYLSIQKAVAAARAGIDVVLFKPVTARDILRRIGANADAPAPAPEPDAETLERAEREHILRVLADCKGNVSLAANRLGIYRSSLQRRLRKCSLAPPARSRPPG
jgi:two-component system response regulator RegA